MILIDANILLYAIDQDSSRHTESRSWLEELLSGPTAVGLPWTVLLAVLRLSTRSGIFRRPLTVEQATGYVDSWLDQPFVEIIDPGPRHWRIFSELLIQSGTVGNVTSDAHLAALALERRAAIATADSDFKRFPGLEFFNPLEYPNQDPPPTSTSVKKAT